MGFGAAAKDNPLNWKLRVGALFRITVYIHIFFLFGAAIIIGMALKRAPEGFVGPHLLQTFGVLGMLFAIVLIHEFGHCFGARATGGEADEILLWPLGGLASVRPPHTPRAHLVTTAAGPAVNVLFCIVTGALLVARAGAGVLPWNPLTAIDQGWLHDDDALTRWLVVFFAINYILLLFNLLPIYPMDGGRMLHAILWRKKGYRDATLAATYVGIIGAIVLAVAGLLTSTPVMMMIAVFGGWTCYSDRRAIRMNIHEDASEFGYDFSKGHAAFDDESAQPEKQPGFFERRRIARDTARQEQAAEEAQRHRERVDRILDKVHRTGMASLTPEERRVLEKETERQRIDEG